MSHTKLRNELVRFFVDRGHRGKDIVEEVKGVMALLKPQIDAANKLRKGAAKWDKVRKIAKRNELDGYPCDWCPVEDRCDSSDSLCGQAESIVRALEKDS